MTTLRLLPALLFAPVLWLPACAGSSPVPRPQVLAGAVQFELPGGMGFTYDRGFGGLKPFGRHLRTASGRDLLADAPPDHEHHHGLMFACGVDDLDFWGEKYAEHPGAQREVGLGLLQWIDAQGDIWNGCQQRIEWRDRRGDRCVLREQRDLLASADAAGVVLLSWRSRLQARQGAQLWGRHYFGLGLRFAAAASVRFLHSDGAEGPVVRGDERLTAGRWCAAVCDCGDEVVTLVLLAPPDATSVPTRFFTMAQPFAYLAATLDLEQQPRRLAPGQTLDLTWALAIHRGVPTVAAIEQTWRRWTAAYAGLLTPP